MDLRSSGRRALVVIALVVLGGPIAAPAIPVSGLSICPTTGPGPGDPHPGPAVPFIGGTVSNDQGAPIASAVVVLNRCVLGVPLLADLQLTASDGTFEFGNLTASANYVVYAPLEGVLAGLSPMLGTLNPSWVIQGSQGDDHVDMAFE